MITGYLYDYNNIIAEYDQSGNIITRYTHGLSIVEPLSIEKNSLIYYYHLDGLGSVTAITNAGGSVVQTYSYDSFGKITPSGSFAQPFAYTNREFDSETELYYFRARYYDPKVGRFLERDPLGFDSGDSNLYAYVGNNSVNVIDPFGLESYQCKRPLGGKPGDNQRSGPDMPGNPFYHQYSCTRDSKGNLICGGQGIGGKWWGGSGKPTSPDDDYYHPNACKKSEGDNKCFEKCLAEEWSKPRPRYGVPFGTDCQEYDNNINKKCRKQCN